MPRPRPTSSAALAALGVAAVGAVPAVAQEAPVADPQAAEPTPAPTPLPTSTTTTPAPPPAPPSPPPAAPPAPAPAPTPAPAPAPEAAPAASGSAGPDPVPARPTAPGSPTAGGRPDASPAGDQRPRRPRDGDRDKPASEDRDGSSPRRQRDRSPASDGSSRESRTPDAEAPIGPRPRKEWTQPAPPAPSALPTAASGPPSAAGPDLLADAAASPLRSSVLERFRIPPFLLPIYQAAGTQYGVRWEVLAAINEIETDFGRNLNVSSAGAQGWMQFMPATWEAYGTDANRDGERDPYNPVDAIFAAARYLKAAGAGDDLRKAIWAYNHADWYVEDVLERARRIAALPTELVDGLAGLTQGRFPVLGDARLDRVVRPVRRHGRLEVESGAVPRRGGIVFTDEGAPVIAVQDGRVVAIGRSARLGRYLILEDAFGNRYTYARLGDVARSYAVAEEGAQPRRVRPGGEPTKVLRIASRPLPGAVAEHPRNARGHRAAVAKERLAAHPRRPGAQAAAMRPSAVPVPDADAQRTAGRPAADADARRSSPIDVATYERRLLGGIPADDVERRPLRVGSEVPGGTVLGFAGKSPRTGRDLVRFEIRPGGEHGPRVDPVPFLDGLRLAQRSGMDRRLAHAPKRTVGQVLLMGKQALIRRILSDERITFPTCGRQDVQSGVIDRRVLATLAILAESGLHPTVTSLRCDHGVYTKSGNVSHHSTGTAVDIGSINGVRIQPSTQGPGSITERTIKRLLQLQGSMAPAQIISLMRFDGEPSTVSMGDHHDHIHIGWRPGGDSTPGGDAGPVGTLTARQWRRVVARVGAIDNPRLAPESALDAR